MPAFRRKRERGREWTTLRAGQALPQGSLEFGPSKRPGRASPRRRNASAASASAAARFLPRTKPTQRFRQASGRCLRARQETQAAAALRPAAGVASQISAQRSQVAAVESAARSPRHDLPVFAALDLGTNNCRLLVATPAGSGFTRHRRLLAHRPAGRRTDRQWSPRPGGDGPRGRGIEDLWRQAVAARRSADLG